MSAAEAPARRNELAILWASHAGEEADQKQRDLFWSLAGAARVAEVFYGSLDYCETVLALADGAASLPAPPPPESPRFILFEKPLKLGKALRWDMGTDAQTAADVSPIGLLEMPKADVADAPLAAYLPFIDDGEQMRTGIFLDEGGPYAGNSAVLLFRLAFWILDNPDLMTKETIDAAPRQSKAARRRGKPHAPSPVTIVDLRAAHRAAAADVAHAERTYRSRWIVRGHWHRFWTGTGDERRLVPRYVMPYVKGPAGAPLNVTERVKKW